jgi:FkbM family methyltransferase
MIEMRNVDPNPDKVFVDIGFNKGYNFAIWATTWMPHLNINPTLWYSILKNSPAGIKGDPMGGQCEEYIYDNVMAKHSTKIDLSLEYNKDIQLQMYGVDLNPTNLDLVYNTTTYIKEHNNINLNIQLLLAAAAKENGEITVLKCTDGNYEGCLIIEKPDNPNGVIKVPMVNVEKIIEHFNIKKKKNNVLIDILLIDTEGHDAQVLQGAKELLKLPHLIRMVSFEYHKNCPWPLTTLESVIYDLALMNYICYYQGQGRLFRITGCWDDLYEMNMWSNIVCIKRHDIWYKVLEKYRVNGKMAYNGMKEMGRLEKDQIFQISEPKDKCN